MSRREIEWKPMRSGDVVVPAEVLAAAWGWWSPGDGRYLLEGMLIIEGRGFGAPLPDWLDIADRMIQKARKAGVITHLGGGRWEWVE